MTEGERALSVEAPIIEPRSLVVTRALVALGCFAAQLLSAGPTSWPVTALAAAFMGLSLVAVLFRRSMRGGAALLGLIGETVFFLAYSAYGADRSIWLSSALYLHLLFLTIFVHRWWDTLGVVGICAGFLAIARSVGSEYLFGVVFWAGVLAIVLAVHKSRMSRRLVDYARQAHGAREMAARARDAEREKLAGDFHDGPLQSFIAVQMRLAFLAKLLERDRDATRRELRELQELSKSQIAEIRAFLRGIRPVGVGEAGLAASLRQAVAEFQKDSGITATFQSSGSLELPTEEASTEVIQIAREALHNAQKHSKATRAAVTVTQSRDCLELSIEDNGVGFSFSGVYSLDELEQLHMGPLSIQRRVRALGGELRVESRSPRGCAIAVRVPARPVVT